MQPCYHSPAPSEAREYGSCSKWAGAIFVANFEVATTRAAVQPIDCGFIPVGSHFP